MTKCDFCVELQAKGENPACVDACPYRALEYGELSELQAKHGNLNDPAPMPDPSLTRPSIVYSPHKDTRTTQAGGGHVLNID